MSRAASLLGVVLLVLLLFTYPKPDKTAIGQRLMAALKATVQA